MPRWLVALMLSGSLVAFACNDETVEEVSKDVCYSGKRWIGDKRGSPEMFPGRDCVGCHIENDGPPLAIGGTLYAYVLRPPDVFEAQSGEDCFGIEGYNVTIEDNDGQIFQVATNRAGNFYVEGNPDDFAKPFTARIEWTNGDGNPQVTPMQTSPQYGGCAHCHSPDVPPAQEFQLTPADADYANGQPRIGLNGYKPAPDSPSVEQELRAFVAAP